MVETQVTGRKQVSDNEEEVVEEMAEEGESEEAEKQEETQTQITGTQGLEGIEKFMPEVPEVEFNMRHDGKLIATVAAKTRNALTSPFITRYVVKKAEEDYGRVAVEAASKTPATSTGDGGFTCTIRLNPTR